MLLAHLFIFLTYILGSVRFSVLDRFTFVSTEAHNICLNLLPKNPQTQATLQALVCGHNFESYESSYLYTSSGLIHLFVVSGAHLIIIEKILTFLFKPISFKYSRVTIFILLFLFCLVCQLNPPIVRGYLSLLMSYLLTRQHKYWPRDYVVLITGLLCLALKPQFTSSLGLQMSWLAALAITMNERYLKTESKLLHQITFYAVFIISFSCLGLPQFAVIAISYIFTPLLEFVLLPLAFLILLFPFLDLIFEKILLLLNLSLSSMELSTTAVTGHIEGTLTLNWILIFSIHALLHFKRRKT